jgi:GDP-mannose transporter
MDPKNRRLSVVIGYYSLCSSTLLIVNKLALHFLPVPVSLLSVQFWFAVAVLYALQGLGVLSIEPLRVSTAWKFAPVVATFLGTLYCNAKVLQFSNVETFITFRSSTPLILCVCDYLFLGRQLPSVRSLFSIVGVLASCAGYTLVDHAFDVRAYSWLAVWFVCFTTYEVVVKHLCDNVSMDNWTRVLYTNTMAGLLLACFLPFSTGERAVLAASSWSAPSAATVLVSCVIGMGVSHSAYLMRSACSATLSAIVGILCKVITVIINTLMWERHASRAQLAFLALGLISGLIYEQAPMRVSCASKKMPPDRLKGLIETETSCKSEAY